MKKLLLVCCLMVGFCAVSHAQRQTSTPAQSTAALKNELALSDTQAARVLAIYTEQAKAMESMPAPAAPVPGAPGAGRGRGPMSPLVAATNAKIKEVLNPEQALTFQYHQDLQRAAMAGLGGN